MIVAGLGLAAAITRHGILEESGVEGARSLVHRGAVAAVLVAACASLAVEPFGRLVGIDDDAGPDPGLRGGRGLLGRRQRPVLPAGARPPAPVRPAVPRSRARGPGCSACSCCSWATGRPTPTSPDSPSGFVAHGRSRAWRSPCAAAATSGATPAAPCASGCPPSRTRSPSTSRAARSCWSPDTSTAPPTRAASSSPCSSARRPACSPHRSTTRGRPSSTAPTPQHRGEVLEHTGRDIAALTGLAAGFVAFTAPTLLRVAAPSTYDPTALTPAVGVVAIGTVLSVLYLSNVHLVFASGRSAGLALVTPTALARRGRRRVGRRRARSASRAIGVGMTVTYAAMAAGVALLARRVSATRWRESRLVAPPLGRERPVPRRGGRCRPTGPWLVVRWVVAAALAVLSPARPAAGADPLTPAVRRPGPRGVRGARLRA